MSSKQLFRVSIEIILGIIISVIVNTLLISAGFSAIKSSSAKEYAVSFLGINIYNIQSVGGSLKGTPVVLNMVILGFIFSLIIVVLVELFVYLKVCTKKKHE